MPTECRGAAASDGAQHFPVGPVDPAEVVLQEAIALGANDIGQPLRSVTREWLVPRLVEKFLRSHGVELRCSQTSVNPTSRISAPVVESEASAGSPTQDSETLMNKKRPIRAPR
jgi:hypothetical protein